ncbi:helix-turn-helix domain-containing protein [Candidatus Kaiserbacteria bacterium]|nr:helix-turn-helix domain-containing protein [Candidatus Kaiserbacteria bacterium]
MNEIVIEDKKYVSSKRAAEITGYAKDYIGQLCREGRVPARLIGRNWYVLESAIQDHRFGDPTPTPGPHEGEASVSRFSADTWEVPRYEALDAKELPPVDEASDYGNTPPGVDTMPEEEQKEQARVTDMREEWQAWFDKSQQEKSMNSVAEEVTRHEEPEEQEIPVSIKPIARPLQETQQARSPKSAKTRRSWLLPQLTALFVALIAIVTLALNSGYFDTFTVSYTQASVITGIRVYNK